MSDKLALNVDEATSSYFHLLLDKLTNIKQILCDLWDMQYFLDVVVIVKDHISSVLDCVYGVIIGLHHLESRVPLDL